MSSLYPCSAADATCSIRRAGLYIVNEGDSETRDIKRDDGKGKRFAKFWMTGYFTKTPSGLEFVFENTAGDKDIWSIVPSILQEPRWGYSRFFSAEVLPSEYAWFFHNRNHKVKHDPIHALIVQLWLPGSKVVYYEGSQLQCFHAEDNNNFGILNTLRSNMKISGITERVEDMPDGGYSIIDVRLGWTCEAGGGMNLGFAEDDEIAEWGPLELPGTKALRAKVAELESRGLRTNIAFVPLKV